MSRLSFEIPASIAASAIMALMVAAGGTAMAPMPSDAAFQAETPEIDRPDPLTVCRVDGDLIICVREET
jgi:hypothetical protein